MVDDDRRDPATGLIHRQALLEEVWEVNRLTPAGLRRGCLLVLKFPVLAELGEDMDEDALRHLLAILVTRLRTRDTMGRISRHSLCILLKGCRESDAVVVADQYVALLTDIVLQTDNRRLAMDMRYRIIPLDGRGKRSRQGVSRLITAPPVDSHVKLAKQIVVAGNSVDLSTSKVVSLNQARADRFAESEKASPVAPQTGSQAVISVGVSDNSLSWRLRPGMLIQRKPLICCFRLQPVGLVSMSASLQKTDVVASVLQSLALKPREIRPTIESQLILPVHARQIDAQFPDWIVAECKTMRVAPSDICLSLSVDSLSSVLSVVAPVLRVLNRYGIRLMLEGLSASSQLQMMMNISYFDYIHISGRMLNDSLNEVSQRLELESIIKSAKAKDCEICSGGIDSPILMEHALAMHIEIGFGRQCGASTAFPVQGWGNL